MIEIDTILPINGMVCISNCLQFMHETSRHNDGLLKSFFKMKTNGNLIIQQVGRLIQTEIQVAVHDKPSIPMTALLWRAKLLKYGIGSGGKGGKKNLPKS